MKPITIKVTFDDKKRAALEQFLTKKGAALDGEVAGFLQKLYERTVPTQVREFIENTPNPAS